MFIRGICCLRTGVEGYTDNIKVISIVGRFLEHSRIYVFGTPDRAEIYISSADFMTRNTEKRVEVAAPIYDEVSKEKILEWFEIMLHDNVRAREQKSDGTYVRRRNTKELVDSQSYLYEHITKRQEEQEVPRKALPVTTRMLEYLTQNIKRIMENIGKTG